MAISPRGMPLGLQTPAGAGGFGASRPFGSSYNSVTLLLPSIRDSDGLALAGKLFPLAEH